MFGLNFLNRLLSPVSQFLSSALWSSWHLLPGQDHCDSQLVDGHIEQSSVGQVEEERGPGIQNSMHKLFKTSLESVSTGQISPVPASTAIFIYPFLQRLFKQEVVPITIEVEVSQRSCQFYRFEIHSFI